MHYKNMIKNFSIIHLVNYLEKKPIWIAGLLVLILSFLPCLMLGEGVLFDFHDTYDGALITYKLHAKYLFSNVDSYPELMNGIPKSGMVVPAPLFVFLYYFFDSFTAHMLQYIIVSLIAFWGMYLCSNQITNFKCVSTVIALLFALLPVAPVYGLSVAGIPLVVYAFICLYEERNILLSYISITFFVLCSSLVCIGFACIGILIIICITLLLKRVKKNFFFVGSILLFILYMLTNISLICDTFLNNGFESHRIEFVLNSAPFFASFKTIFLASADLAVSCHYYMIIPIFLLHFIQTIRYKWMESKEKKMYQFISFCLGTIMFICLFYALNFWNPIVKLKDTLPMSIKHFQIHRICLFLPTLWYLVAAASLWEIWEMKIVLKKNKFINDVIPYLKVVIMFMVMFMTIIHIRRESIYRHNLNQLQNPSIDYGVSYEEYFAEELFAEICSYINKEQESYRVVSLGLCPAIPLYNGFYCVDGYSNNYPIEYKHKFREIIEKEINKNNYIQNYFDNWGSRCYLFSSETDATYNITKGSSFTYKNLEINTDILKELGCEYIFSAAPIENADILNLKFLRTFSDDIALYDVYLYKLE